MSTAARLIIEAREKSAALVEHERSVTGSKMTAYRNVARRIGASSSWLRHLIGRQEGVRLEAAILEDLRAVYASACERIEARADRIEAELNGAENAASKGGHPPDCERDKAGGPQASGPV